MYVSRVGAITHNIIRLVFSPHFLNFKLIQFVSIIEQRRIETLMTCHTTLTQHPPILFRRSDILSVLTSRKLWSIIRLHVTVKESRIWKKERSSSWSVMGEPHESSRTEFIFCGNDSLNRSYLVQLYDQQIITYHISLSFRIAKRRWGRNTYHGY